MSKIINICESDSVIFLDIDGVLNNDNEETAKGEYIVSEYVQNLAKLVELTKARIVLTSTWRIGLKEWIDSNFCEKSFYANHYKMLFTQFALNNLQIADMIAFNQEIASKDAFSTIKRERPFEIREWLQKNSSIKHFAILDDEDNWDWGNLHEHVVLTNQKLSKNLFGAYGFGYVESKEKGFKQEKIAETIKVLKLTRNY